MNGVNSSGKGFPQLGAAFRSWRSSVIAGRDVRGAVFTIRNACAPQRARVEGVELTSSTRDALIALPSQEFISICLPCEQSNADETVPASLGRRQGAGRQDRGREPLWHRNRCSRAPAATSAWEVFYSPHLSRFLDTQRSQCISQRQGDGSDWSACACLGAACHGPGR